MSTSIDISFESRDRADLAMSALRHAGIAFRATGGTRGSRAAARRSAPVSPEYCANMYFPHPAALFTGSGQDFMNNTLGSRAIIGDYSAFDRGSVRLRVRVPDEHAEDAGRILRNQGGYDAH